MSKGFEADVIGSVRAASANSAALDAGMEELRIAVADRDWGAVENIRAKILAAADGFVDNYVAAARRVEHEREEHGRQRAG